MPKDVEKEAVKSSEDIIADLLNDIKSSEKSFSVDKLAGCNQTDIVEEKPKIDKHRSSHRSKKSKKERRRSRTWSRSRSPSRSRKRSKERKKSRKRKRSRSRSRSRSKTRDSKVYQKENHSEPTLSTSEKELKQEKNELSPNPTLEFNDVRIRSETDDATMGETSVFRNEVELKLSISTVLPEVEEKNPKQSEKYEDGEIEDYVYGNSTELQTEIRQNTSKKNVDQKMKGLDENDDENLTDKTEQKKKKKDHNERTRKRSRSDSRQKTKDEKVVDPVPTTDDEDLLLLIDQKKESVQGEEVVHEIEELVASTEHQDGGVDRETVENTKPIKEEDRGVEKAEMMSNGDRNQASIEDFVTYCKKLQKRQEREKRREAGQAVSDHESDGETVRYKHPYAIPKDAIRINIVTATSINLAQKAITGPEEPAQLGSSQLRIVYPVSSGAVHKENAEWVPVEKEETPKSCSTEQKKHVALTSLEIDRCRAQGIPVAPVPIPKFLDSILPPPPQPPQFLPNPNDAFRPPTPPALPSVLYIPSKEKMILKEPNDIPVPAPSDIGKVLKQRTEAQRKVLSTPNDFEAHRALREANEQIKLWAALKSLPGEYTGTTGLRLLTADELQPHNPKFHAWVKKDQFRNAAPATTGIGRMMLEKMGWRPGEGLGKDATGNVEPLVLDVKSDRKGLMAEEEMSIKQRNKVNAQNNVPVDLSTKNPVSLLMELCAKRRWDPPVFTCEDSGAAHMKMFIWTVVINNVEYRPMCGSKQKKKEKR
uniref:Protein SON n=1 Tax=Caenorhabditis tropicalis TaxID=1561998 RepID=A0A1I7TK83_9PELO